ncbi:MAG: YidB family protein [Ramlibacter sp.]
MSNDLLGQILGSVLGNSSRGGSSLSPGGLGDVLGNMMGGRAAGPDDETVPMAGKGGALLAMLLPLAMQWVQRNGGVGALIEKFQNKGYSRQAASWISAGENEALSPQAVGEVVGMDELSRLSQQLGVPQDQVASGLSQILPQVVDHLTPSGQVPEDADDMLASGLTALENMLGHRAAG